MSLMNEILRSEVELFTKLSGEDGLHTSIGRIGAYLDGYKKGKSEMRWIPVSDPPDTDRNVFIARGEQGNMTVCIGHYGNEYKQWYEDRNWFGMLLYDGLYWCEIPTLPEPYRGEGEHDAV